ELGGVDHADIAGAVDDGLAVDGFELGDLGGVGRDQDLAAAAMRDRALGAARVEQVAAGDAQPRLEAARRVVQAGVDDAAVARRRLLPDLAIALEDRDRVAAPRERGRAREPDHAGADDESMNVRQDSISGPWPSMIASSGGGSVQFTRGKQLAARLRQVVPGGCHTYAKGDDQYPELSPSLIARGKGCHVWDVD